MDIIEAVDSYFRKENEMKKISEFMAEKVKPIKLTEFKYTPFKLNEADDDMDFGATADDAGGDDAEGGTREPCHRRTFSRRAHHGADTGAAGGERTEGVAGVADGGGDPERRSGPCEDGLRVGAASPCGVQS